MLAYADVLSSFTVNHEFKNQSSATTEDTITLLFAINVNLEPASRIWMVCAMYFFKDDELVEPIQNLLLTIFKDQIREKSKFQKKKKKKNPFQSRVRGSR
jgi:predicted O-linked N-acetylglucosamine transferase (SPINDLY family)